MASACGCSSASTYLRRRMQIVCKAGSSEGSSSNSIAMISRRNICFDLSAAIAVSGLAGKANAAILEADEDDELMEKIKSDRKKRIEKQVVIGSSTKEKAYLQDLVYKLSEIGQAIEKNDLSVASSVLGSGKNTEWVQKVNSAFNKLSSSEEEKTEVDAFNSSFTSLISSVSANDVEGSKVAFVACASALEKWSVLSGLVEQLKGL